MLKATVVDNPLESLRVDKADELLNTRKQAHKLKSVDEILRARASGLEETQACVDLVVKAFGTLPCWKGPREAEASLKRYCILAEHGVKGLCCLTDESVKTLQIQMRPICLGQSTNINIPSKTTWRQRTKFPITFMN